MRSSKEQLSKANSDTFNSAYEDEVISRSISQIEANGESYLKTFSYSKKKSFFFIVQYSITNLKTPSIRERQTYFKTITDFKEL